MYKILEFGGHRTETSRGANIVGMSVWPPDVYLSPYLAKKKKGAMKINQRIMCKMTNHNDSIIAN